MKHAIVLCALVASAGIQQAAPQRPPDTEIFLSVLRVTNGAVTIGAPENITNNPGYDNQPFFTPDDKGVLFTSVRGGTQTDIYKYDIITRATTQITHTPESEYSPTVTPLGQLSVVRVELDGRNTQRLWQFSIDGKDPHVIFDNVKPVGYHAWATDHIVAMFVLGPPATLQLADVQRGAPKVMATDIGRSLVRIPGRDTVSFVQRETTNGKTTLVVKELDPATGTIKTLTPAVPGSKEADLAWTPDRVLLMVKDDVVYSWTEGQTDWRTGPSLERMSLRGVTRIAVSPQGDYIALVGSAPSAR